MTPSQQNEFETLLRSLAGKSPDDRTRVLEEVARRDPELAAHLSIRINQSSAQTAPIEFASLALEAEAGLPKRFELRRKIGEGGFGSVYEAFDRERQERVAVKVLRKLDAEALYRFKQEFRVLADLRHRNLIRFHELSEYRQVWFFTMELVSGKNFLNYVRSRSGCDEHRLRLALDQLARVLMWLHERSVLHRDVKPENIIVTDDDRLVLLDFGLARHVRSDGATGPVLAGTPAYMAPEQLSDAPITGAADWYAVGTLLYQALTDKLPFEGSAMHVLRAKCSSDAPPLPDVPAITGRWHDLCRNLLAREPSARATGGDILLFLGSENTSSHPVAHAPGLVGRAEILEGLKRACARAITGSECSIIDIRGPSGFGKSTIMRAFWESVRSTYPDAIILRGRCYEHESMPFKGIDALIDDLSRHLRSGGVSVPAVPQDAALLARLFPVLKQVPGIASLLASAPALPANPVEFRRRAFAAFAELLDSLCQSRLVVMCIDDAQWGDRDSAALLQAFLSRASLPPMVIATTYRSDTEEADFVRTWRELVSSCSARVCQTCVDVGPLEPEACLELARLICARLELPPDFAQSLAIDSAGNPMLLEQLAAHAADAGVDSGDSGANVRELVRRRIGRLSASAREFLEVLAAAGEPLPEEVVGKLAPAALERSSAIQDLISQRLIRKRETGGSCEIEIYHDEIRGALISSIPDTERRAIYHHIAEALESIDYRDHGIIAVQYAQAGEVAKAAQHALLAATAAESALAFDRAAQFYGIALATGEFDRERKSEIYEALAVALAAARRNRDAVVAFLQAAQTTSSIERNIDLRRRAAEHWIQIGELREGLGILNSLGREFRIRYMESRLVALVLIGWSRITLRLRGMQYKERPPEEIPRRELARLDLYWALTAGLALYHPLLAQRFQGRYQKIALRSGEPKRVALAIALEGGMHALAGERGYYRSRALIERAQALGRRLDDPHVIGFATAIDAISSWLTGRWNRACEAGEQAHRLLRENCSGSVWELSVAANGLIGGLIWTGRWNSLAVRMREFIADAHERGDALAVAGYIGNSSVCSLAADDPEGSLRDLQTAEAALETVTSKVDLHIVDFFGRFGRMQTALYANRPLDALEYFEQNRKRMRHSLLQRVEILALLTLLIEANVMVAAASEMIGRGGDPGLMLDRARQCRDRIRAKPAIWSAAMAFTIDGGIEAASGRLESAAAAWEDAQKECERVGMAMYAAAAQYWNGRVAGDNQAIRSAEAIFREQNVVRPERIAAMLIPGFRVSE